MRTIPDNMKTVFRSEKSGNLIILGRLMYGSFFTSVPPSKNERDPKKFQYGTTLLIPGVMDISVLEAEIKATAEANIPAAQRATTKWKNPLLKTSDTGKTSIYADDYPWIIRPNSKQFERKSGKERPKPGVIDNRNQPVTADREADECYNGRWARLSVQDYWYPANDGLPGVALGLVNVQLLWNDDPLAGGKVSADADFEAIDDAEMAALDEEFA